jgi:hypothetical protein
MKNEIESLKETITSLKDKQAHELKLIKGHLHDIYEDLKPINLIKNTIQEIACSQEIKSNLVNNAIGLGAGHLSRKILIGSTHNPIKKIAGTILQFAITNLATKHSKSIKAAGQNIFERILKYTKEMKPEFSGNKG